MKLRHKGAQGRDHLTISAGVAAIIPGRGHAPAELLEKADKALYRAKGNGRDCVRLDTQSCGTGALVQLVQAAR
jgi:PleD family two-component response regulator